MWICNMYYLDFFNVLCQRTRTKQDLIIVNFTYYCTIFKDKRNYVVLLRIVPLLTHALSTNNSFLYITKPIIYGWWIEQCPIMIWLHQSNHQKVERWDPPKQLAFIREKFAARKKSQKLKSIPVIQSVREQRCDVWNSSYNSQSSVQHFENQQC